MAPVVLAGDCLDHLRAMPDSSVDAIVTDPPYGLADHNPKVVTAAIAAWTSGDREHVPDGKGFMGRTWDAFVPPPAVWDECLRVLRPGGHLLCFAGTRTVDLMGLSIRLAGFEIRDSIGSAMLAWVHGQGFPKRKTQLKPAWEPILVARKPLRGTVAANVIEHGTGALNVDACRVGSELITAHGGGKADGRIYRGAGGNSSPLAAIEPGSNPHHGRWPANVVLSHSGECADQCQPGCPVAELDAQSGTTTSTGGSGGRSGKVGAGVGGYRHAGTAVGQNAGGLGDSGGASRFFPTFRYQAKAPTKERPKVDGVSHPTVKPLALMRWLVRLVTPPAGTVLDPFAGSGTTLEAALLEGLQAIGIERDHDYLPLIAQRMARANTGQGDLFDIPA